MKFTSKAKTMAKMDLIQQLHMMSGEMPRLPSDKVVKSAINHISNQASRNTIIKEYSNHYKEEYPNNDMPLLADHNVIKSDQVEGKLRVLTKDGFLVEMYDEGDGEFAVVVYSVDGT